MTAREKAEELIDKFDEYASDIYDHDWSKEEHIKNKKQCALITVEYLIESIEFTMIQSQEFWDNKYLIDKLNFYDNVKQELINL